MWYTFYRCHVTAQILATLIFGIPCLFGRVFLLQQ
jgi:hypothetical protein